MVVPPPLVEDVSGVAVPVATMLMSVGSSNQSLALIEMSAVFR